MKWVKFNGTFKEENRYVAEHRETIMGGEYGAVIYTVECPVCHKKINIIKNNGITSFTYECCMELVYTTHQK